MKVNLLIATQDNIYAKLLSDNISEHHIDIIDVSVCSALEGINEAISNKRYNVALIDPQFIEHIKTDRIHLPLLMWSEDEHTGDFPAQYGRINKHQRISSIVSLILERYAKVSNNKPDFDSKHANITAVWSPAGGVGKTSVALAYAISHSTEDKVSDRKEVFYLNLEDFSSVPVFFSEKGKSISTVFEMLESNEGNLEMLIQGIRCCDKGITFLGSPDNFDDLCILSSDNVHELVSNCAKLTDELIIDLSCACNQRVRKVFELAGKVLIVTDGTTAAEAKITQFMSQNGIYESIKEKVTIISNKEAKANDPGDALIVSLPYIQSDNATALCNDLAGYISKARV